MAQSYEVVGADRLERTMREAGRKLAKLTAANREFGNAVVAASHPPRRTGRLASSATVDADDQGATVAYGVVYAGVIEYGWAAHGIEARHFLGDAFDRTSGDLSPYTDHIDDALNGVKGA